VPSVTTVTVHHFTDPGCPWAYSARPAHARLRWRYGDQLDWRLVMVGLSETAEAYVARGYTPEGVALGNRVFRGRFGMPFELHPKPRVAATSRACRAIVAARRADPALGEAALRALQFLQFTTAGLLDDDDDLRAALATVPGLDAAAIVAQMDAPDVLAEYEGDRARTRSAEGSPTEAQGRASTSDGPVRYTAPSLVFEHADGSTLEAGGFQVFEAYDLVLANLDPSLERRPPPATALEGLRAFPEGLTTAEVASVLRPSDLVDADPLAVEDELISLVADGSVRRRSVGHDALWSARAEDGGGRHAASRTAASGPGMNV
jgi:protein-disulfide isomerase-like protein with CxxC motif